MSGTNKRKEPKTEIVKNPAFRTIHANGIFGGLNPQEGSITFFTDVLEPEINENGEMILGKIKKELQIDVRLTLPDFIRTAQWMNGHIKRLKDSGVLSENIPEKKKLDYGV